MSNKLKKIFCSFLLYVGCFPVLVAQDGPPPPPPPPPPGLPIDGQIIALGIAGFLLGIYAVSVIAKRTRLAAQ